MEELPRTSPRGALGSRRRPCWCAGLPCCSWQVRGRRFASDFLSSSPADCLFRGVVGASWLLPSALTAQRPLGTAPAPLGPLLRPPQVPGVGPSTSPGLRSGRWRRREVLLGKLPQKGSQGRFLQLPPTLLLLGWPAACATTPGLGQALLPGAWPVALSRLSLALCPPCRGGAPSRQVTHSPSSWDASSTVTL